MNDDLDIVMSRSEQAIFGKRFLTSNSFGTFFSIMIHHTIFLNIIWKQSKNISKPSFPLRAMKN
jgi:hypothetical protein